MALLLWSGGCDSTIVLFDLLTAAKNGGKSDRVVLKEGEFVRTLSINHPQVAGDAQNRKARQTLLPLLRERFKNKFVHGEITVRQKGLSIDLPDGGGLAQPAIWLLHASSYLEKGEDLYTGYIKTDDIWHYSAWLNEAFRCIQGLTYRTGVLRFPLEWSYKSEVIHRLRKARLLKHTWHCELPKIKDGVAHPCKKCASCGTHATALWRLKVGIDVYDTPTTEPVAAESASSLPKGKG